MSHPRVLARDRSVLLVIDVQDAYRGIIFEEERLLRGVRRLIEAAKLVGVPVLATEQYPRGLGHTMPEIHDALPAGLEVFEKRSLSCYGCEGFAHQLRGLDRSQIVVCGLETHACVNQTIHDLLVEDYQVHLPIDATSSRFEIDYHAGLQKLEGSGVIPCSVEMVCLEWVRTAEAPEFKAVQRLIK